MDIINNQRVGKDVHEVFHRELDNNPDRFGVIAEYLGRRLFDKVRKWNGKAFSWICFLFRNKTTKKEEVLSFRNDFDLFD